MLPSIEDRGQADRVTANAIPIALPNPLILTLTLTYDLDFLSPTSLGHDPYTRKQSRPKVTSFQRYSGNRRKDGHDRLRYFSCYKAVGNNE